MIRGGVVLSRGCFGFMPPLWCVLLRAGLTRAASCSVRFAAIAGSSAHSPLLDAYSAFPLSACGPSARSPPAFFSALPRFAASPPLRLELSEPDEPLSPLLFWLALESCWLPLLLWLPSENGRAPPPCDCDCDCDCERCTPGERRRAAAAADTLVLLLLLLLLPVPSACAPAAVRSINSWCRLRSASQSLARHRACVFSARS